MGKIKKVKISAAKRSQHLKAKKKTTQKLIQQQKNKKLTNSNSTGSSLGQLSQPKKKLSKKDKKKSKNTENDEENEVSDSQLAENVMDILEADEEYSLQNSLDTVKKRNRKRKYEEDEVFDKDSTLLEKEYTKQSIKINTEKKMEISLLPIKNKEGEIITRTTKIDYKPRNDIENGDDNESDEVEEIEQEYEDSDDDIVNDDERNIVKLPESKKVVSTTDLLILRQQEIERQKYRIGIICSGILEKPEDKMKNFTPLFELMDEHNEQNEPNLLTVRKIACASIGEVFKDILPEYRVGQVDTKMTTLRKATLQRVTFESALLQQFKKYLLKLEKITAAVTKKGGGKKTPHAIKMCEVAVHSLCDLLLAHPYFNYVQNAAQLLVYVLDSNYSSMRETIFQCFKTLFVTDKRLDMTLFIVRRINHLIKTKSNIVHLEMIKCLLSLKIKNVNLDAEKESELKQKKLENHRQRLLSLSKKERKRRKKLTELNRELQETKAEESKQSKHHKLTEITKMVFTIYFRILKNDPNSKLLSACLEGLAEFAHVINLDFFSDLIESLDKLLYSTNLGYREQLHCVQTIFAILSGQGEVLNIDPIRFYTYLYRNLLVVNAGKNHGDFLIILKTLIEVFIKRRKNISHQRLLAFIKRIITQSLQLLHNGTLGALGIIKTVMQLTSNLDIILDMDSSVGSGRFDPELDDPEYCNANCTALYELGVLHKHYHPTVRKMAMHIAIGVPSSGEGSLPPEIGKLSPEDLFTTFDSSKVSFNPTIPIPKKVQENIKKKTVNFLGTDLSEFCNSEIKKNSKMLRQNLNKNIALNFYENLNMCG